MKIQRSSRQGCLLTCLLLLVGCAPDAVVDIQASGDHHQIPQTSGRSLTSHEQMQLVLQRVANDGLQSNSFFQTGSLEQAISALAAAPDTMTELMIRTELANDYRRLGESRQAIDELMKVVEIIERNQLAMARDQEEWLTYEIGLSFLRLAETENCIHCRTGESCILPISAAGQHKAPEGSRRAVEYFGRVLQRNPDNVKARWLLNIAMMTVGQYPHGIPASLRVPESYFKDETAFPRFVDVATAAGIKTINCGGGAVAEDFDGDGDFDLLTSTWDPAGQIHYFRNDGTGKFDDLTETSGLTGLLGGINMVQGDYDNDGDVDVFVLRGAWLGSSGQHPNSLIENDGQGNFQDVTFAVGIGLPFFPSSSAAWLDLDNDGDLDLFVANETAPCQLFRNDGKEGFTDIASQAGVANNRFSKGVTCGDVNNDGWIDIYVSNLDGPNRLYLNQANGSFIDVAVNVGVEKPLKSFPTWFWDVNNDGNLDLFVASYDVGVEHIADEAFGQPNAAETDCLYLGNGNGTFVEATERFGLNRVTQPMGANFGDLDNDGYLDFYLGTGYPSYDALMPNLMFHNRQGNGFESVSFSGGFAHLQKGHGTAFCDFDADGDQDVFIQMGGAYPGDAFGDILFQNPGFGNHWIRVKAVGTRSNRSSIGARIRVVFQEGDNRREVYRWVNSGGSFGSHSLQQHIGIGQSTEIESIEVYWPASGQTKTVQSPPIDQLLIISEDT